MTDLVVGIIAGYGWTTPMKHLSRTNHHVEDGYVVDFENFKCSCGKTNCEHWCRSTKMLKTDCPCHNNGCGRVEPFVVSLRRSGYKGRCVLITGNGSVGADVLSKYDVETYDAGNFTDHACLVRPGAILEILKKEKDIRYVLAVDTRDIIFQSDPLVWVENNMKDCSLIVTSEGKVFDDNTPGAIENSKRFIATYGREEYLVVKDSPICNGGAMVGTPEATIAFREAMQTEINKFPEGTPGFGPRSAGWPSDQIIMNYLVNKEPFRSQTTIVGPRDGFVFHRPYAALGATVRDNIIYPPDSSDPYPIVHQYLEWSPILWPKYSDEYQILF